MGPTELSTTGSAERWGPLWGDRPAQWAQTEEQHGPAYEEVFKRVPVGVGTSVLDVGCGVGVFLREVADRGAEAHGIDAAEALIAAARVRVPEADLRVADMEALPFDDDTFDLVTGFTSFFFAADMVNALREARRVAKSGGAVAIQVWGPRAHNELEGMKEIMRTFLPALPADAPPDHEYWRPGVLESMAIDAGLVPGEAFNSTWAYEYPDEDSLGQAMLAPAGLGKLAGPEREDEARRAIIEGLAHFRRPDGSYRLQNEYRYLLATK